MRNDCEFWSYALSNKKRTTAILIKIHYKWCPMKSIQMPCRFDKLGSNKTGYGRLTQSKYTCVEISTQDEIGVR